MRPKLNIIVPCYNEEKHISKLLQKLFQVIPNIKPFEVHCTIVNDCSTDNTLSELQTTIKGKSNTQVVSHKKNQGKGAAILTGLNAIESDYILVQDGDLELDPFDIIEMCGEIIPGRIEFVNGSRYMPGKIRPLYAYRRYYFNKSFTRLASILVDVRFTDLACGYKLVSTKLLKEIALKEKRFGIEAEMILKIARKKKNQIVEVPVNYYPRNKGEGKKIKNTDGLRILWTIIKYGLFKAN